MGLRTTARKLVYEFLEEIGPGYANQRQPISLTFAARILNISTRLDSESHGRRGDAVLWEDEAMQLSLLDSYRLKNHVGDQPRHYKAVVHGNGLRSRFSLAHEVAHGLIELRCDSSEEFLGTSREVEVLADFVAAYLLVPDLWLRTNLDSETKMNVSLEWLFSSAQQLGVSRSSLINRLNTAALDGVLTFSNGALAATSSGDTGHVVRIKAASTPMEWSIANHGPLSNLGTTRLTQAFWSATPEKSYSLEDTVRIRNRKSSERLVVDCVFRYVVVARGSNRELTATFNRQTDQRDEMSQLSKRLA